MVRSDIRNGRLRMQCLLIEFDREIEGMVDSHAFIIQ